MEPWWTAQQAGMIGGIGGAAIGMAGAAIGSMSFLIARGKGKPVIVGAMVAMVVLGAVLLTAGVVAAIKGQPYHVLYPLLLGGSISIGVFGALTPMVITRYRAAEARRLQAEELRRS